MSKIKNCGLDQYGAEPFERHQFGTAGVEGVNTWRVPVDNRRDFWVLDPKNLGPKNYLFSMTSQLNGNFDIDNGETALETIYEEFPTSSQNLMNFGPLAAKNRSV